MSRGLKIKSIHRRIFLYLGRGDSIKFIQNNTKLKYPNLYKKIRTLEKHNYLKIKRIGRTLNIQLQPLAIKELSLISAGAIKAKYIRLHDVWISCPILSKPTNWSTDFAEKILEEKSIPLTRHSPKNWKGIFFDYSSVKVRVTPNKIMINPPWIEVPYNDSPERAKNLITNHLSQVIPRIENLFNISISKPRKISVTISSQHIAFVKNEIAKFFLDKGISLRIYDKSGKLRVIADKSNGNYELEAIDKAHAEEDAEKLKDLIQDTVTGKFNPRQINRNLQESAQIIRGLALNQKHFSNNMIDYGEKIAAHIRAIEQMGAGVKELSIGIKKLTSLIERMEKK